jgi:hypothetical protein
VTRQEFNRARAVLHDRLRRDRQLHPHSRIIGAEIISLLNFGEGGIAWPSHDYLIRTLGLPMKSMTRAVRELKSYLLAERRGRPGGRKYFYKLHPDMAQVLSMTESTQGGVLSMAESTYWPKSGMGTGHHGHTSSLKSSLEKPAVTNQHQHRHHQGSESSEMAAELTTELFGVAQINHLMHTRPAMARRELRVVQAWLDAGFTRERILESAQLMLERRSSNTSLAAIVSLRYFEAELKKNFDAA